MKEKLLTPPNICTILPWEYLEREGSDGRSSVICQGSGVEFTLMMPMKMKK